MASITRQRLAPIGFPFLLLLLAVIWCVIIYIPHINAFQAVKFDLEQCQSPSTEICSMAFTLDYPVDPNIYGTSELWSETFDIPEAWKGRIHSVFSSVVLSSMRREVQPFNTTQYCTFNNITNKITVRPWIPDSVYPSVPTSYDAIAKEYVFNFTQSFLQSTPAFFDTDYVTSCIVIFKADQPVISPPVPDLFRGLSNEIKINWDQVIKFANTFTTTLPLDIQQSAELAKTTTTIGKYVWEAVMPVTIGYRSKLQNLMLDETNTTLVKSYLVGGNNAETNLLTAIGYIPKTGSCLIAADCIVPKLSYNSTHLEMSYHHRTAAGIYFSDYFPYTRQYSRNTVVRTPRQSPFGTPLVLWNPTSISIVPAQDCHSSDKAICEFLLVAPNSRSATAINPFLPDFDDTRNVLDSMPFLSFVSTHEAFTSVGTNCLVGTGRPLTTSNNNQISTNYYPITWPTTVPTFTGKTLPADQSWVPTTSFNAWETYRYCRFRITKSPKFANNFGMYLTTTNSQQGTSAELLYEYANREMFYRADLQPTGTEKFDILPFSNCHDETDSRCTFIVKMDFDLTVHPDLGIQLKDAVVTANVNTSTTRSPTAATSAWLTDVFTNPQFNLRLHGPCEDDHAVSSEFTSKSYKDYFPSPTTTNPNQHSEYYCLTFRKGLHLSQSAAITGSTAKLNFQLKGRSADQYGNKIYINQVLTVMATNSADTIPTYQPATNILTAPMFRYTRPVEIIWDQTDCNDPASPHCTAIYRSKHLGRPLSILFNNAENPFQDNIPNQLMAESISCNSPYMKISKQGDMISFIDESTIQTHEQTIDTVFVDATGLDSTQRVRKTLTTFPFHQCVVKYNVPYKYEKSFMYQNHALIHNPMQLQVQLQTLKRWIAENRYYKVRDVVNDKTLLYFPSHIANSLFTSTTVQKHISMTYLWEDVETPRASDSSQDYYGTGFSLNQHLGVFTVFVDNNLVSWDAAPDTSITLTVGPITPRFNTLPFKLRPDVNCADASKAYCTLNVQINPLLQRDTSNNQLKYYQGHVHNYLRSFSLLIPGANMALSMESDFIIEFDNIGNTDSYAPIRVSTQQLWTFPEDVAKGYVINNNQTSLYPLFEQFDYKKLYGTDKVNDITTPFTNPDGTITDRPAYFAFIFDVRNMLSQMQYGIVNNQIKHDRYRKSLYDIGLTYDKHNGINIETGEVQLPAWLNTLWVDPLKPSLIKLSYRKLLEQHLDQTQIVFTDVKPVLYHYGTIHRQLPKTATSAELTKSQLYHDSKTSLENQFSTDNDDAAEIKSILSSLVYVQSQPQHGTDYATNNNIEFATYTTQFHPDIALRFTDQCNNAQEALCEGQIVISNSAFDGHSLLDRTWGDVGTAYFTMDNPNDVLFGLNSIYIQYYSTLQQTFRAMGRHVAMMGMLELYTKSTLNLILERSSCFDLSSSITYASFDSVFISRAAQELSITTDPNSVNDLTKKKILRRATILRLVDKIIEVFTPAMVETERQINIKGYRVTDLSDVTVANKIAEILIQEFKKQNNNINFFGDIIQTGQERYVYITQLAARRNTYLNLLPQLIPTLLWDIGKDLEFKNDNSFIQFNQATCPYHLDLYSQSTNPADVIQRKSKDEVMLKFLSRLLLSRPNHILPTYSNLPQDLFLTAQTPPPTEDIVKNLVSISETTQTLNIIDIDGFKIPTAEISLFQQIYGYTIVSYYDRIQQQNIDSISNQEAVKFAVNDAQRLLAMSSSHEALHSLHDYYYSKYPEATLKTSAHSQCVPIFNFKKLQAESGDFIRSYKTYREGSNTRYTEADENMAFNIQQQQQEDVQYNGTDDNLENEIDIESTRINQKNNNDNKKTKKNGLFGLLNPDVLKIFNKMTLSTAQNSKEQQDDDEKTFNTLNKHFETLFEPLEQFRQKHEHKQKQQRNNKKKTTTFGNLSAQTTPEQYDGTMFTRPISRYDSNYLAQQAYNNIIGDGSSNQQDIFSQSTINNNNIQQNDGDDDEEEEVIVDPYMKGFVELLKQELCFDPLEDLITIINFQPYVTYRPMYSEMMLFRLFDRLGFDRLELINYVNTNVQLWITANDPGNFAILPPCLLNNNFIGRFDLGVEFCGTVMLVALNYNIAGRNKFAWRVHKRLAETTTVAAYVSTPDRSKSCFDDNGNTSPIKFKCFLTSNSTFKYSTEVSYGNGPTPKINEDCTTLTNPYCTVTYRFTEMYTRSSTPYHHARIPYHYIGISHFYPEHRAIFHLDPRQSLTLPGFWNITTTNDTTYNIDTPLYDGWKAGLPAFMHPQGACLNAHPTMLEASVMTHLEELNAHEDPDKKLVVTRFALLFNNSRLAKEHLNEIDYYQNYTHSPKFNLNALCATKTSVCWENAPPTNYPTNLSLQDLADASTAENPTPMQEMYNARYDTEIIRNIAKHLAWEISNGFSLLFGSSYLLQETPDTFHYWIRPNNPDDPKIGNAVECNIVWPKRTYLLNRTASFKPLIVDNQNIYNIYQINLGQKYNVFPNWYEHVYYQSYRANLLLPSGSEQSKQTTIRRSRYGLVPNKIEPIRFDRGRFGFSLFDVRTLDNCDRIPHVKTDYVCTIEITARGTPLFDLSSLVRVLIDAPAGVPGVTRPKITAHPLFPAGTKQYMFTEIVQPAPAGSTPEQINAYYTQEKFRDKLVGESEQAVGPKMRLLEQYSGNVFDSFVYHLQFYNKSVAEQKGSGMVNSQGSFKVYANFHMVQPIGAGLSTITAIEGDHLRSFDEFRYIPGFDIRFYRGSYDEGVRYFDNSTPDQRLQRTIVVGPLASVFALPTLIFHRPFSMLAQKRDIFWYYQTGLIRNSSKTDGYPSSIDIAKEHYAKKDKLAIQHIADRIKFHFLMWVDHMVIETTFQHTPFKNSPLYDLYYIPPTTPVDDGDDNENNIQSQQQLTSSNKMNSLQQTTPGASPFSDDELRTMPKYIDPYVTTIDGGITDLKLPCISQHKNDTREISYEEYSYITKLFMESYSEPQQKRIPLTNEEHKLVKLYRYLEQKRYDIHGFFTQDMRFASNQPIPLSEQMRLGIENTNDKYGINRKNVANASPQTFFQQVSFGYSYNRDQNGLLIPTEPIISRLTAADRTSATVWPLDLAYHNDTTASVNGLPNPAGYPIDLTYPGGERYRNATWLQENWKDGSKTDEYLQFLDWTIKRRWNRTCTMWKDMIPSHSVWSTNANHKARVVIPRDETTYTTSEETKIVEFDTTYPYQVANSRIHILHNNGTITDPQAISANNYRKYITNDVASNEKQHNNRYKKYNINNTQQQQQQQNPVLDYFTIQQQRQEQTSSSSSSLINNNSNDTTLHQANSLHIIIVMLFLIIMSIVS